MNTAIIGAGIGGLTAGLLLNQQGHRVTIYEKEEQLGGRLKYETNGRYRIDQGPTIVLLPELMLSVLEEAGVDTQALELIHCDPMYDIHYHDGMTFTKWNDVDRHLNELERCFPGESEHFKAYMDELSHVYQIGTERFLNRTFLGKREFLTPRNAHLLWRAKSYQSVEQVAKRHFKDERLQQAYSLQTLYIGGAPSRTPSLYASIPYGEHAFGIWYLKGGYAGLVQLLEQTCLDRGITIERGTKVDEILIEGRTCKGIRIGKEKIDFQSVVYNGDFPHLHDLMNKAVYKKKPVFQPSSGCLMIYAGVKKRWDQAKMHQYFLPKSFETHMRQVFQHHELPQDPAFYVFNPVALDSDAAPAGESVLYFLVPVTHKAKDLDTSQLEELSQKVLQEAEQRGFDGLRDHLEWLKIRTPRDAEREGLFEGGSFGLAPTLNQSGGFRPQIVPLKKYRRLYCVGASVHPGGGIPIVMLGARLLKNHMAKEL